ncbi:hypothetical protein BK136_06195 [Paenibacillus amylolyticus]|nr:hypothetical protein BK136_06195 [Paenibacillus amylolyticus]
MNHKKVRRLMRELQIRGDSLERVG